MRQISSYWTNFIRCGDPNGRDTAGYALPEWQPFTKEEEFLMLFRDQPARSPNRTDERTKALIAEKTGLSL